MDDKQNVEDASPDVEFEAAAKIIMDLKKNNEVVIDEDGDVVEIEVLNEESVWENSMDEEEIISVMNTPEYVVADTADEMVTIIDDYCERTSNRFSRNQQSLSFRAPIGEINFLSHKVLWQELTSATAHAYLQFDGVPYMIVGYQIYGCQYGRDKNIAQKRKYQKKKENSDDKSGQHSKTATKKCGCPAKITVKRIVKFPEYKINRNTHFLRIDRSKKLKTMLREHLAQVKTKDIFLGILPSIDTHQFHETVCCNKEPVDKELVILAQELALKNISVTDILNQIQSHVENEIFFQKTPPDKQRRRYNPSRRDVQNFIHRIRESAQLSLKDLQRLKEHFEGIREKDNESVLYFDVTEEAETITDVGIHQHGEDENDKKKRLSPLLVTEFSIFHQTSFQRHLLRKYGHVVYVVEVRARQSVKKAITFKLFVLMVQTNVDHQIVGTIMYNKHHQTALRDALNVCKQSNLPFWLPKILLVDICDDLVDVVTELFPDAECFFNCHSCLRSWNDFLSHPTNGLTQHRHEVLTYLKTMQLCTCKEELSTAASFLEQSDAWQTSIVLRNWFEEQWLPLAKKWVKEYRAEDLSFFDSNALCDHLKKYEELLSNSTRNISQGFVGLCEALTKDIPEQDQQSYASKNKSMYNDCKTIQVLHPEYEMRYGLPLALLQRSLSVIEQLQKKFFVVEMLSFANFAVTIQVSNDDITTHALINDGIAHASDGTVEQSTEKFVVSFEDAFPSCPCAAWQQNKMVPCLHVFAVFEKIPTWKYDSLSTAYRSNVLLELDYSSFSLTETDKIVQRKPLLNTVFKGTDVCVTLDHINKLRECMRECENLFNDKECFHSITSDLSRLHKTLISQEAEATYQDTSQKQQVGGVAIKKALLAPVNIKALKVSNVKTVKVAAPPINVKVIKKVTDAETLKNAKKQLNEFITKTRMNVLNETLPPSLEPHEGIGAKRKVDDTVDDGVIAPAKKLVNEDFEGHDDKESHL